MGDKPRAQPLESATRGGLVRTRRAALLFSLLLPILVLSPVVENFKEAPEDGFPLSHFPMFATKRDDDLSVTHLVGVASDGRRTIISYAYAGLGGFNSARKRINRIRREGGSEELCRRVARTISERRPPELAHVRQVRVVTGNYEYQRFFDGQLIASDEKVHAACRVE